MIRRLLSGAISSVLASAPLGLAAAAATERSPIFLPLKLDYLGEYVLPYKTELDGKLLGGLSGISYNAARNRFYVMSDDRSEFAPARFYELNIKFANTPKIDEITVTRVVTLQDHQGKQYTKGGIDPEGIWVANTGRIWTASEGISTKGIKPFVHEVDLETGRLIKSVSFGAYFNPKSHPISQKLVQGVRNNEGFESLTGFSDKTGKTTLFAATEYALVQDVGDGKKQSALPRILSYSITQNQTKLIGEYAYPLDLRPIRAPYHGLVDLMAIDHKRMLSLERSYGQGGFTLKLFQLNIEGATSFINQPVIDRRQVRPIHKRLLLNLKQLGVSLDNYEGVILGPQFSDGSHSLIIVSDNNFSPNQRNSFLLFRIRGLEQSKLLHMQLRNRNFAT